MLGACALHGELTLVLLGGVTGLLIGLTGIGGGSIMTPLLIMLGLPPVEAVGTDLVFASVSRLVGVAVYGARGRIRRDIVSRLTLGSVVAVILGGALLRLVRPETLDLLVELLVALMLLVTSTLSLMNRDIVFPVRPSKRHAIIAGLVVGLLVQFTSIGAGVIVGFALLHVARLEPAEVVATTLLYGLVLGGLSAVNYILLGAVRLDVALALLAGSIPGVVAGSLVSSRARPNRLKRAINVFLLLVALTLLARLALRL